MKPFLPLYSFGWFRTRDPFDPGWTPDHLTRLSAPISKEKEKIVYFHSELLFPYHDYANILLRAR
jgi:hypothetical protein